ncbi:MAG: hypothetical protein ACRD8W_08365 [Nitrososphaeraceae archaeon]
MSTTVTLLIKLSTGFVQVIAPSAISALTIFLIVYTFVGEGPSIRPPPLSLVVIVAVKAVLGLIGFFMPNISSLMNMPAGMLTGLVTSYVIELPDFNAMMSKICVN